MGESSGICAPRRPTASSRRRWQTTYDGSAEPLIVHGVDLAYDAAVRVYHEAGNDNPVDDLLPFLNQPDSIMLVRDFAQRRGLENGAAVELVTPRGLKRFTIRGLLEPT